MLAFVLHKTNKYKKDNQEQQYFVFEKQTFLEHFDETETHSIISNCLITNYTKPETYNKQILDLYKQKNTELFTELKGEFSFGIWDKQKQTFFGGRDRVGVKPFYYYNDDDIFIYSTTLKYIKDFFGFTELNEYWIADALSGIVYDKTSTQFPKIFRMPPAHYIIVDKEKFEIKRYWELKVNKIENISEEEAIKLFREKLFEAVNSRFFPHITGTELSGGLDSSGVTSIAAIRAKEKGSKLYSYSQRMADKYIGKIPPYKDEREYSDLVAKMYPNIVLRPITAEDRGIIEPMKKVIDIVGAPTHNTLTYLFDEMYEKIQLDNIKILLSGFGGDEFVSNKGVFYLQELADKKQWGELKKQLSCNYLSHIFIKYFIKKNISCYYNKQIIKKKIKSQSKKILLNEDFIVKNKIKDRLELFFNKKIINPQNIDNKHYIQNRLEETSLLSTNNNFDISYPLLDIDLIELYININSKYKYKLGVNRYLYRTALINIIHTDIINRDDKTGATVPNIYHRLNSDIKIIEYKSKLINQSLFNQSLNNMKIYIENDTSVNVIPEILLRTIMLEYYFKEKN